MTSKRELEEILFEWTAGSRLETLKLLDALYFIEHSKHDPQVKRDYPDELASKSFIKAVKNKLIETRRELRKRNPSGKVKLYRGGSKGDSWTTNLSTAKFFAKDGKVKTKEVPLDDILFYLEPYTREAGEEEYILKGEEA